MVLPSHLQHNLMPSEINFVAENELITILPRYSMNKIELIGHKIPALRAMRREKVPIWVAVILKSQDKCSIVPPKWLNLAYLKDKYEEEIRKPQVFSELPWNWLEISKVLLAKAADDLSDPSHQLRSVLQDLREIRLVKSHKGLRELNESNIQLNGLSLLEINELRPFVLTVMNKLRQLHDTTTTRGAVEAGEGDDMDDEDNYDDEDD
ncbi:DNA replication complex GINS protein PSF2 [Scheffersomyces xylosifermentans]|uniref:DNA replication complex GINS protein PSF2 n=1 Tax=Scheffersomyces xylosifermentans TaxID=1304137 RepID=UPI00315DD676